MRTRRAFVRGAAAAGAFGGLLPVSRLLAAPGYPAVAPGRALVFPRDHGAHPEFRTEWWYVTGWLGDAVGFQITFFRSRPGVNETGASAFAPRQLLFAHAAIADRTLGHLLHDQRAARAGLGRAEVAETTTDVRIDDWSLALGADGRYRAAIAAREFALDLEFAPRQPTLLQGDAGYSRKGANPREASYYYSRPHLAATGRFVHEGKAMRAAGEAWLDHEWSSEMLAPDVLGWDWIGIALDDGGALMAFRMRRADGSIAWAGGTLRTASGTRTFAPTEVRFEPLRRWRSPRIDAEYPVALRVRAGDLTIELAPLMDDQELDARASVGTVYWEGAVEARRDGVRVGRGYLELTGYWRRLDI